MASLLSRALLLSGALLLARLALLTAMLAPRRSESVEELLWAVELAAPAALGPALLAGAVAAVLQGLRAERAAATRALLLLVEVALFALVISGAGSDRAVLVPGVETGRGLAAWGAIVAVALALAAFSSRREPGRLGRPAVLVAGAVWLGVLFSLAGPLGPTVEVVETARSLVAEPDSWTAVPAPDGAEPVAATLVTGRADRDERPALVVPPGASVEFVVAPDEAPGRLRTAVGLDLSTRRRLTERGEPTTIRFEVRVGEQLVAERELAHPPVAADARGGWRSVGPPEGVPVEAGDRVSLRTAVRPPLPTEDEPWLLGFADPILERRRAQPRTKSSAERPNLVLIVVDTLRADRLGAYGYERPTSPRLDALAEQGLLFERAYSTSSWTWPSVASILTGHPPERHGVVSEEACYLSWRHELVSEALRARGLATALFSGSPLISPSKNFAQGFDRVDLGGGVFRKSKHFIPDACDWVEEVAGERFFLYLHLVDPHHPHFPRDEARAALVRREPDRPYDPRRFNDQTWALRNGAARPRPELDWDTSRVVSPVEQEHLSDLYDACVATSDHWIGVFLDALRAHGLADETIVAVTSDHGEELFDHGLLEHGHSLHRELVEVPLILAGPGIPRGERRSVPVSNRHLAATLARLGGAELADVRDGVDLLTLADDGAGPVLFSTEQGWWNRWHRTPIFGIRDDRWVLHLAPRAGTWGAEEPTPGGEVALYDTAVDPEERNDLAETDPERAAALASELRAALEAQRAERRGPVLGAGSGTLELLRGIGYLEVEDR